ncbi:MAG: phage tail tip lysozyme [Coriobacteriia bacterium]|nr:phage tail tip lysozyme [Coriobacteriia bacterium]
MPGTCYWVRVRAACYVNANIPAHWSAWSMTAFKPTISGMPEPSVTTTASGFWTEAAASGSLIPNNQNNTTDQGRGSVLLTWKDIPDVSAYLIYLHDGNQFRQIASTTATSWATSGKGIFPTDAAIAGLPMGYTASTNPYASGTGTVDLRDDPRPLYKKAAGSGMDDRTDYLFKVVPASVAISACETIPVSLENRTYHVNDDPRHTTYSIGDAGLLGHSADVVLDKGTVEFCATDLEINWWGPRAALERHYSSGRTTSASWAPGWRFNYEQSVTQAGGIATYTDAAGEAHRFGDSGGTWISAHGFYGTLTKPGDWQITYKDGHKLVFDGTTGRLKSESDRNGNTVTYTPSGNNLLITAGNGHMITVNRDSSGVVSSATYKAVGTFGGTRTVTYATGATPSVTYYYGGGSADRTLNLTYASNRLASLSHAVSGISLGFSYDGAGIVTTVRLPGYATDPYRLMTVLCEGTPGDFHSSKVVRYGRVATWDNTPLWQDFDHPENGLRTGESVPYMGGTQPASWRYTAYSPTHEAIRATTPLGHVTRRSVDGHGLVRDEYDADGGHTSYEYNARGQATRTVSARGSVTTRTYDQNNGDLLTVSRTLDTSGAASLDTYAYTDPAFPGVMTSAVTSLNATENAVSTYSGFAPNGRPGTSTQIARLSPGAPGTLITTHRTYTAFGDLAIEYLPQAPAGLPVVAVSNQYEVSGRNTYSADASGTGTAYFYDQLGRMTSTYRENSASAPGVVADWVKFTYGDNGQVETERRLRKEAADPGGVTVSTVTCTYDQMGRLTETDDSTIGGLKGRTHYDTAGNVIASWPEGVPDYGAARATRYAYDADGRMASMTLPGESVATTLAYTPAGREETVSLAGGKTTTYTYDAGGKKIASASVSGTETAYTSCAYDLGGRMVSSSSPGGATVAYAYDLADRPVSVAAEGQDASETSYNEFGQVLREAGADGVVSTCAYDALGNVLTEDVGGEVTTNTYDTSGHLTKTTDPDGLALSYGRDVFGRTTAESQTAGAATTKAVSRAFDSLGRVTEETQSAGAGGALATERTAGYTYPVNTAIGATRTETYGGITTTVFIGPDGLETSRESTGPSIQGTFGPGIQGISDLTRAVVARDSAGRETQVTVGGATFNYEYDSKGRLERQWGSGLSSARPANPTYTYDNAGRKKSQVLPDSFYGMMTEDLSYNAAGRVKSSYYNDTITGQTSYNIRHAYDYDKHGNITRGSDSYLLRGAIGFYFDGVREFSYDGNSRLERFTPWWDSNPMEEVEVKFNALGQRISESSALWPLSPDRVFTYTGAGQLRTFHEYRYSNSVDATYTYDATGQRKRSVFTYTSNGGGTTIDWVYSGSRLLSLSASRTDNATWGITYLYDGAGRPYAGVYTGSDTPVKIPFSILTNDRGEVISLLSSNGTAFARYDYSAWGRFYSNTSGTRAVPADSISKALAQSIGDRQVLQYRGAVYDRESELYYASGRYYDEKTMQFPTPAKANAAESPYAYDFTAPFMYDPATDKGGALGITPHPSKKQWSPADGQVEFALFTDESYAKLATFGSPTFRRDYIYNNLTSYDDISGLRACAILGNIAVETWGESYSPLTRQGDLTKDCPDYIPYYKADGEGWGILQWTRSRKQALWDYAQIYNNTSKYVAFDVGDLEVQLAYFAKERKTTGARGGEKYRWDDFMKADDASLAAMTESFCDDYESAGTPHMGRRIEAAEQNAMDKGLR